MENRKRVDMEGRLQKLPEDIIQHIQSFLGRKEAALTALISKSWYNSYLTRPILDFDQEDFRNVEKFMNFLKKTMDRYHELNLKIDTFKLSIMNVRFLNLSSLVTESITRAVEMCVSDLGVEVRPPTLEYVLPKEVFESEYLKRLFVSGCKVDGIVGERVKCSRLKFLCFTEVFFGDGMVRDIISSCPLIEKLFFWNCYGEFRKLDISKLVNLEKLGVIAEIVDNLQSPSRNLEVLQNVPSLVIDCQSNVREFHKLSSLVLDKVMIDSVFFHDFSRKFPCIEDLTVSHCFGCTSFSISSQSLKYITVKYFEELELVLDVPNIYKFSSCGTDIPSLSFTTASREWESCISLTCSTDLEISWFVRLNKLLTRLSGSRISLNITLYGKTQLQDRCFTYFQDMIKPVVEYLTLKLYQLTSVCPSFLDGILRCFRPKVIEQRLFPVKHNAIFYAYSQRFELQLQKTENRLVQLLCKKLMDIENGNCSSSTGDVICWNELEGVNVESCSDTRVWRSLSLKNVLDDSSSPEKEVQIRFRLRWRPPARA